jgi:hypothetical protein
MHVFETDMLLVRVQFPRSPIFLDQFFFKTTSEPKRVSTSIIFGDECDRPSPVSYEIFLDKNQFSFPVNFLKNGPQTVISFSNNGSTVTYYRKVTAP